MSDLARRLRGFGAFWVDFVIGDDWSIAVGVGLALAATVVFTTWWLVPVVVSATLTASLWRATRRRQDGA